MIRRTVLASFALLVLGGATAPAWAGSTDDGTGKGEHVLCIAGGNRSTGSHDGICIWIPGVSE